MSSLGQVVFCSLCCETQSLKLPEGFLMLRLMAFLGYVQESIGLVLLLWYLAACLPGDRVRIGLPDLHVP